MRAVAAAFLGILVSVGTHAEGSVIAARMHLAGGPRSGLYAAPSVEVVIPLGGWGFGARVESLVGFDLGDVCLAPCLLLRIGRVDLGIGASFLAVPPAVAYAPYEQPSPVFLLGVTTRPLFVLGPGTVRLDFGLCFFVTAVRASAPGVFSGLADMFNMIGNAVKAELGLSYVLGEM